jgi:hypothetical protein
MDEFVLFQSFMNESDAIPVMEILRENKIEYKVEKFKEPLDSIIGGDVVRDKYYLKIKPQDFPKANEALDQVILKSFSTIEPDYYLFSFSNDELLEIIKKPDEWSRQDFLIAKKILDDRGKRINDEEVNILKSKRIRELAIEEKEPTTQIIAGYIFAFLFSLVGVFFGLALFVTKKSLPDGRRVFAYTENTRNHGRAIFMISMAMLILFIVNRANIIAFLYHLFDK